MTTSEAGPVGVVHVSGEVDLATSETMAEQVFGMLAERPSAVVVDLTSVAFMGSTGLGVLIEASQRAQQGATTFRIVASSSPVLRPLEISGLKALLPVFASMPEALQGIRD
ncbi:MAG: STAS domain-containing protein [Kibdelosporangium sp.]